MTVHITLEAAIAKVAEVVDEKPDFVYEQPTPDGCVYLHEGEPSCLIGVVLHRFGVPLREAIYEKGVCSNSDGAGIALEKLRNGEYVTYEEFVPEYFQQVQDTQDAGQPWRSAQEDGKYYLEHKDDEDDD